MSTHWSAFPISAANGYKSSSSDAFPQIAGSRPGGIEEGHFGEECGIANRKPAETQKEAPPHMCDPSCVERIVTNAVTLFVVVNPIGLVPLFISTTRQETPEGRRSIALRSVLVAAAILVVFIVIGQILLNAMGVTIPSFRIAGGLVLFAISMKMILGSEPSRELSAASGEAPAGAGQDVAVFPLAMPFIAGPATIMAAVLLTDNEKSSIPEQAVTVAILLGVLAFTYAMMLAAEPVQRAIGPTGANVPQPCHGTCPGGAGGPVDARWCARRIHAMLKR